MVRLEVPRFAGRVARALTLLLHFRHFAVAYAGMQLCHRYFAVHSFKKNDRYVSLGQALVAGAGNARSCYTGMTCLSSSLWTAYFCCNRMVMLGQHK